VNFIYLELRKLTVHILHWTLSVMDVICIVPVHILEDPNADSLHLRWILEFHLDNLKKVSIIGFKELKEVHDAVPAQ
jgi:hypothetical protein